MNQTLEAMARAIFQDWFVAFGPVRAKMEGQDPYLPPELWNLFPDDLVDSELGEIPEGWKVGAYCHKCPIVELLSPGQALEHQCQIIGSGIRPIWQTRPSGG